MIVVFLQCNSLTITIVSQKHRNILQPYSSNRFSNNIKNFLCKQKIVNNCSILSMHAERQITNLSVKHSSTLYPTLSPYRQMESKTEEQIHLLRLGWRNFFSSCAVVSVLGSGGKQVLVLHTYVLRVRYSCGVVLVFGSGGKWFLV